jgi:hypothetical protein
VLGICTGRIRGFGQGRLEGRGGAVGGSAGYGSAAGSLLDIFMQVSRDDGEPCLRWGWLNCGCACFLSVLEPSTVCTQCKAPNLLLLRRVLRLVEYCRPKRRMWCVV